MGHGLVCILLHTLKMTHSLCNNGHQKSLSDKPVTIKYRNVTKPSFQLINVTICHNSAKYVLITKMCARALDFKASVKVSSKAHENVAGFVYRRNCLRPPARPPSYLNLITRFFFWKTLFKMINKMVIHFAF